MEDLKDKIITKYNYVNFSEFDFDKAISSIISSGATDIYKALENDAKLYIRTLLGNGDYGVISNIVDTFNISEASISECMNKINELDDFLSDIGYDGDDFSYVGMLESCDNLKLIVDKIKGRPSLTKFCNITFEKLFVSSAIIDSEKKIIKEAYNGFGSDFDDDGIKLIYSGKNSQRPPITKEEEIKYFERIRSGDEDSKLEFLERNYRLVLYFASKVSDYTSLSLMDLFQEGYFGLVEAVDKFDPFKGFKFSTYAGYCIKTKIGKAISKYNQVKLPVDARTIISKFRKQEIELEQTLGRKPEIDEIAKSINVSSQRIYDIYNAYYNIRSLDAPIIKDGECDSDDFLSLIVDPNSSIFEEHEDDLNRIIIDNILKKSLTNKQLEIVRLRFGFYGNSPLSLQAIGDLFGTSRQNINIILKNALKKLVTCSDAELLADCSEYPFSAKKLVKQLKNNR